MKSLRLFFIQSKDKLINYATGIKDVQNKFTKTKHSKITKFGGAKAASFRHPPNRITHGVASFFDFEERFAVVAFSGPASSGSDRKIAYAFRIGFYGAGNRSAKPYKRTAGTNPDKHYQIQVRLRKRDTKFR